MRDQLPELLHEKLPADARAQIEAHVATCAACREELELLRQVRQSVEAHRIDASRIAAALPPYRASRWGSGRPYLRAAAVVAFAILASLLLVREAGERRADQRIAQTPTPVTAPPSPVPAEVARRAPTVERAQPANELALAEAVTDLSNAELRALLDAVREFDGVTPADPEVDVLSAPHTSGT